MFNNYARVAREASRAVLLVFTESTVSIFMGIFPTPDKRWALNNKSSHPAPGLPSPSVCASNHLQALLREGLFACLSFVELGWKLLVCTRDAQHPKRSWTPISVGSRWSDVWVFTSHAAWSLGGGWVLWGWGESLPLGNGNTWPMPTGFMGLSG